MGVYSTNRLSSLTESAEQQVPVEEEFELTPNENLGSVMEAAIAIRENEQKMFNSLIELDFISATNEATMLEADAEAANDAQNKSKAKAIFDKIADLFDKAIQAIKTAASNLIGKIKELLDRDKKIVEAYGDIKVEDLKGFKGLSNYAFPKGELPDLKMINQADTDANKMLDVIRNAADRDTVDQYAEVADNAVKSLKEAIKRDDFFEEKVEAFIPNQQQITRMVSEVKDAKATITALKKLTTTSMSKLKATKDKAKTAIGTAKGDELEVYKAKTVYKAASAYVNGYMKMFNEYTHVTVAQIAAYRKALVACGHYAKKGSKAEDQTEEKVEESALMYALTESSDEYVYAHFAY